MAEPLTEIEQKLIEFATKASATIQTQSEQIHALSHVLLITLVALTEQNAPLRSDLIQRFSGVAERLKTQDNERFTREYFEELVRFLNDPHHYPSTDQDRPKWFRGIIPGGQTSQPPPEDDGSDPS